MSAFCFGQSEPTTFEVVYDKFQGITKIYGKFKVESTTKDPQPLLMESIARIPDNEKPLMALYFRLPRWQFDNRDPLRLLLNGRLREFKNLGDSGESALFIIPFYDFDRIANSKTVEIQLSVFEGKFSEDTLKAFRKLIELTKPQPR